jgi:amino acid adenylation domain-containing protein
MKSDRYSLSPIQQGMLFHHIAEEHSGVDIEQIVIDYNEYPDLAALETAWRLETRKHSVLRTAFRIQPDGEPIQEVHDSIHISIQRDERVFSVEQVRRFLIEDRARGFDLKEPPLMRLSLLDTGSGRCSLIWTVHHILLDGRSFVIVLNEIEELYKQIRCGEIPVLEPGAPYRHYIEWIEGLNLSGTKDFWHEYLQGVIGPTPLPADPEDGGSQTQGSGERQLRLSAATTIRLRELAKDHQFTLNTIVMAVWGILLSRYGGGNDILFGSTRTSRRGSIPNAGSMVGLFLNTIPVRMTFSNDTPVIEVLKRLRSTWMSLRAYAHTPLVDIRRASGLSGASSLFDSLVIFEHSSFHAALASTHEQWKSRQVHLFEQTSFPLTFLAYGDSEMLLKLEFDGRRYMEGAAERILGHIRRLFEAIAENPNQQVSRLRMLPDSELHRLTTGWNQTAMAYPRETPLAELIEGQVERTPDADAVVFEDSVITYRELNRRANRLAWELCKHGAGPDVPVGVCLERSIDLIVALLAVIKSGGGYVPLDPHLPRERLTHMIEDSGLKVLITQHALRPSLMSLAGATLEIDAGTDAANSTDNPGVAVHPDNLAYVIYTSGSTGKPKGVELTRGALNNLLWSVKEWLMFGPQDRLLAVATISFDIAAVDMWLPLLVGARIILATREAAADGEELGELIDRYGVTFMQATPVTWRLLLEAGWRGKPDLQIVCTGEAMPRDLGARLIPLVHRLWNLYGPTETTIWSTGYIARRSDGPVLIGRPLGNTQCYILDENGHPVPVGVAGELYIAGDGLARGYHNQPALTSEKFVANPFSAQPGARMYRTGDMARYFSDGNIECLGRTDRQVKYRGFRVEPGEIETALMRRHDVRQAVVVAWEDDPGDKRLVAYLVRAGSETPDPTALRDFLKQMLPVYMIPADYVFVREIPISPNGKIDRNALPPPIHGEPLEVATHSGAAARNATEETILAVFRQVLRQPTVGIDDDFFHRGGHSLDAARAIVLLNSHFNLTLRPRVLFEAQTVAQLARIVISSQERPDYKELGFSPTLIPIQPNGSRPPLFCVPRPNANALGLLFLARELGDDQPLYGFEKHLEEPDLQFTAEQYHDTAVEYIHEMRRRQPEGPYFLTAFCHGAHIAFEMARELTAAGQEVALLGMLDVWALENTSIKWLFFTHRIFESLAAVLKPHNASKFVEKFKRVFSGALQRPLDAAANSDQTRGRWEVYWPGPDFKPKAYSGKITVFRVRRQQIYRIRDRKMGWGDRALGGAEVVEIPGSHTTFLREPHVKVLAQELRSRIPATPASIATTA